MIKVAIVEDELLMRNFIQKCVDYSEMDIDICGSYCCAEEALEGLKHNHADLIITDIVMPGMNGIEFMSEVLKLNKQARFIVISNHQDFEMVRSAFRIGICDYISKTDFEVENYRKTLTSFIKQFETENIEKLRSVQKKRLKDIIGAETQIELADNNIDSFLKDDIRFVLLEVLNYDEIVKNDWETDKKHLKTEISNYLTDILIEYKEVCFFFNNYDEIIFLFSVDDEETILNILTKVRKSLENNFTLNVRLYSDYNKTSIRELKSRYSELYKLRELRFFMPRNTIVSHKDAEDFIDSFDYVKEYTMAEKFFQKKEFDSLIEKIKQVKKLKPSHELAEAIMFFL